MKDIVTPVTPEEVKAVVRKCLENGALVNYTHISQMAKVEGKSQAHFVGLLAVTIKIVNDIPAYLIIIDL
jgi:hypothetical protein